MAMNTCSYYIYKLTNLTNDKIYIGKTRRSAYTRLQEHASGHSEELRRAIQEIGFDKFTIEILHTCKGNKDAARMEKFSIQNHSKKGYDMYNVMFNDNYKPESYDAPVIEEVATTVSKQDASLKTNDFNHILNKMTALELQTFMAIIDDYEIHIKKHS